MSRFKIDIPWTDKEIRVLQKLWGKVSCRDIGQKLKRSRNSILGKAYRLGMCQPSLPKRMKDE